ncbi:prephenate dehydrogenase/arogenate dehydrogenase family protein [Polynucleobacter paneuropaeus]|uniref:prephenate dehydrogenase n=1 Tax=Polynucleobacter paneuropaeus TaxID=2527775 RepID=UPI001BFDF6CC|nr:prephenate dehydrogenase/arogenate dehydrogenase family protein [Polynucleobacter paneuropaeus]MBT8553344.1 prephenate dehydrogenase/arogenate dehydrogenase family protein [Polynucleobacter paneuropaeus]MBT8592958.1 prephenate dehydrogenase/arogenate dehydrogenase family protein [Polynucleobacter paneuropaeus]MBT8632412.1 prephenate dehydrogenase/arogenate dehydrogenase family protein [Polynucleobacter paneuropaeus]QWD01642.1 prephenate dehydrogenase/arogenate dehydrogenase family protein [P
MTKPNYGVVSIVGVGLIGASLGLALKQAGVVTKVLGVGRSQSNLEQALKIGAIDGAVDLVDAAKQSDLIVLCVPVAQMRATFTAIEPHLASKTLITDAGSTKGDVILAAKEVLGKKACQFVPAHPIAGGAQHGASAAKADLFFGKQVIICPLQENSPQDIALIEKFWQAVGALVKMLSSVQHDAIYAAVSHLPHILSYALMASVINSEDAADKLSHIGAGFKDFTRIAASSPEMWRDICLANSTSILKELDQYLAIVQHLRKLIADNDGAGIERLFAKASKARQDLDAS